MADTEFLEQLRQNLPRLLREHPRYAMRSGASCSRLFPPDRNLTISCRKFAPFGRIQTNAFKSYDRIWIDASRPWTDASRPWTDASRPWTDASRPWTDASRRSL